MQVSENGRVYDVVIADMATINEGKRLVLDPTYPGVADDFAKTFASQKVMVMDVDVCVAAHGRHYGMQEKYAPGQAYNPDTFVDPEGFLAEVERLEWSASTSRSWRTSAEHRRLPARAALGQR